MTIEEIISEIENMSVSQLAEWLRHLRRSLVCPRPCPWQ